MPKCLRISYGHIYVFNLECRVTSQIIKSLTVLETIISEILRNYFTFQGNFNITGFMIYRKISNNKKKIIN